MRKAKKPRRRDHAPGRRADQSMTPPTTPAESEEQVRPRENYAVDVAPDRIDVDPELLDRENPVCSLPLEKDDTSVDR